mgnify:CR=1 FL=1
MHLLLVGNYGVGNLGDEALKSYFLQAFPEIRWTVLSANPVEPYELPRLPFGLRSLFSLGWLRTLRALRRSDGVVFGGGSLFTDVESVKACWLWWWHVRIARFFGKPCYLASQGIGPFSTRMGERLAKDAVRLSSFLSVRDTTSAGRVRSWGMRTEVIQTFDPVLSLLKAEKVGVRSNSVFVLIPRRNTTPSFLSAVRKAMEDSGSSSARVLLLQPDDPAERSVAETIIQELPGAIVKEARTLRDLSDGVADASLVLAQRYHGALAALALGVPLRIVGQGAGDKLSELEATQRALAGQGIDPRAAIETGESALRAVLASR